VSECVYFYEFIFIYVRALRLVCLLASLSGGDNKSAADRNARSLIARGTARSLARRSSEITVIAIGKSGRVCKSRPR
jgi:hypothetical protein